MLVVAVELQPLHPLQVLAVLAEAEMEVIILLALQQQLQDKLIPVVAAVVAETNIVEMVDQV
tara:strand:+ start:460 stop:645 length:186 start_codon:yes stop_codon:yes gene_type:complete